MSHIQIGHILNPCCDESRPFLAAECDILFTVVRSGHKVAPDVVHVILILHEKERSHLSHETMLTNFTTRRNKSHHVPTFWSFSNKKYIASIWSQGPSRRGSTQYGYVLMLNRGRYPSIKHNSYTRSNMPYESEVTLAPGTYTMVNRKNNIIRARYTPNK